jgi:hypothetical protein
VVKVLSTPVILHGAIVLLLAGGAFAFAIWLIRSLRRSIAEEANFDSTPTPTLESLPLHLYNTVIQQLKQQKHELQVQTLAEQRRARTTENFSQAVLSNLPSGVLVFGQQRAGEAGQSRRQRHPRVPFAHPGMSADDIFRAAAVSAPAAPSARVSRRAAVTSPVAPCRGSPRRAARGQQAPPDSRPTTPRPTGEKRRIAVTVIAPVPAVPTAACSARLA